MMKKPSKTPGHGTTKHDAGAEVPMEGYIFTSSHISTCFILACAALGTFGVWHLGGTDFPTLLGYLMIVVAWAIPTGLWCLGRVHGLPLYPIFCTVNLIAFALPLLSNHPMVILYPPSEHFEAALSVACALLAGSIPWYSLTRKHGQAPAMCLQMDDKGGESLLIAAMVLSVLFNFGKMAGMLILESGLFSLVRGVVEGLSMLGVFVLGQRLGSGRLQRKYTSLYFLLLIVNTGIQITSLFLVSIFSTMILAISGYFLGARRIPWLVLGCMGLFLTFLHGGKSDIRAEYWTESRYYTITSYDEFSAIYKKWFNYSLKHFTEKSTVEEDVEGGLIERSSLMHLMLYMRDMNSHGTPYLEGSSYIIIPSLLLPRFINPDKLASHEGTYLLNINYGLQSREDVDRTTIGFGLINEGYGNFGFLGCIAILLFAGIFLGWVSRWAWGMPVLSFRSLFSVLILGAAFQSEYSLGVVVTTIFQGTMALGMFSFFFMKQRPHSGVLDWLRTKQEEEESKAFHTPRPRSAQKPGLSGRISLMRLALITSHPVQYYAPWFRHIASSGIDLRVFYLWDFGTAHRHDPGFGQSFTWDVPLLDGYPHEFVINTATDPGTHHWGGLRNPDLLKQVGNWRPDAVLLLGYAWQSMMRFILGWNRRGAPLLLRGDSHDLARPHGLRPKLSRMAARLLFHRFAAFLACGKANSQYYLHRGAKDRQIFLCPHAVDMERFQSNPETAHSSALLRTEWNIPKDHRVVLFAGKFESKKRPLDLLHTFQKNNPAKTTLVFVGSGELDAPLRSAAAGDPRVLIRPFTNQSAMPSVYGMADVFVLPSVGASETWGLSVQEALACGVPVVVSSHVGCHPDLVHDGVNGRVFTAGDPSSLELALADALAPGTLARWRTHTRPALDPYTYTQATAGLQKALDFAV